MKPLNLSIFLLPLLALFIGCTESAQQSSHEHEFSAQQALDYADEYTSFGLHRIGTPTEVASTRWIHDELKKAGMDAELQRVPFRRFDLQDIRVEVDGKKIDAFPYWFPAATGSSPVSATLVAYNEGNPDAMNGKVVYYHMPGLSSTSDISPVAMKARDAGALAVIVTVTWPNGEVSAQNAVEAYVETALPLPSVIVSHENQPLLEQAIADGKTASVLITGTIDAKAASYNVIARQDNGMDRWIVVSTPVSGWFVSNAERGGGVGLFIELAKVLSSLTGAVNYMFVGTTGHELQFLGAHRADELIPPKEQVSCWLHLGSAIAAKEPVKPGYKFIGYSDELADAVNGEFDASQGLTFISGEKLMQSELGKIISSGYISFGFFGANRDFHTRLDSNDGIDVAELGKIGEGTLRVLQTACK
jgi:hypothetical protein